MAKKKKTNLILKSEIVKHYKTQRKLVQSLPVTEQQLSNVVRGKTQATQKVKEYLAKKLGCSVSDLFGE